jgi:hypothetical protein
MMEDMAVTDTMPVSQSSESIVPVGHNSHIISDMEDTDMTDSMPTSLQPEDLTASHPTSHTQATMEDTNIADGMPAPHPTAATTTTYPRASLCGLPTELFQEIAALSEHEPVVALRQTNRSLLALRQTCKTAYKKSETVFISKYIKQRTVLVFDELSLSNLLSIAKHPALGTRVEKITFDVKTLQYCEIREVKRMSDEQQEIAEAILDEETARQIDMMQTGRSQKSLVEIMDLLQRFGNSIKVEISRNGALYRVPPRNLYGQIVLDEDDQDHSGSDAVMIALTQVKSPVRHLVMGGL